VKAKARTVQIETEKTTINRQILSEPQQAEITVLLKTADKICLSSPARRN
jgi:hypothetical protein